MPFFPILPVSKDFAPFVVRWTRNDCDKLEKSGALSFTSTITILIFDLLPRPVSLETEGTPDVETV